jgi:hypothetical protein
MSDTEPGFWDGRGPKLFVGAVRLLLVLGFAILIYVWLR